MRATQGFTLIELLVVLVILGLLGGIVGANVINKANDAKPKAAKEQINGFVSALELFYVDMGRYPTTEEGLMALITAPADGEKWNGKYLQKSKVPPDPWARDYVYRAPGEQAEFEIISLGADGAEGGEKNNKDIVSWE